MSVFEVVWRAGVVPFPACAALAGLLYFSGPPRPRRVLHMAVAMTAEGHTVTLGDAVEEVLRRDYKCHIFRLRNSIYSTWLESAVCNDSSTSAFRLNLRASVQARVFRFNGHFAAEHVPFKISGTVFKILNVVALAAHVGKYTVSCPASGATSAKGSTSTSARRR